MSGEPLGLGPYDACLFDMDGTIVNSIAPTERAWSAWARRAGVPVGTVLAFLHGRRAIDVVMHFAGPGTDVASEVAWLDAVELRDLDGVVAIAGAAEFLASLPGERWAVVTSANRALVERRMDTAGLPLPAVLITSDDVTAGKPHPEGYLRAAAALGAQASRCVVFEDAAAGIRAGLAAGSDVVRVGVTDPGSALPVKATIAGYEGATARFADGAVRIALPTRSS